MKLKSQTPILVALFFTLAVGYSFAEKVVVIPLMEEADVSDLVARIEALETKLACVGDLSDAGNFFLNDCNVSVSAGNGDVNIHTSTGNVAIDAEAGKITMDAALSAETRVSATNLKLDGFSTVISSATTEINSFIETDIKSPTTVVEGTSLLQLKGGLIHGGTLPVARIGDTVEVSGENDGGPFVAIGTILSGNPAVLF